MPTIHCTVYLLMAVYDVVDTPHPATIKPFQGRDKINRHNFQASFRRNLLCYRPSQSAISQVTTVGRVCCLVGPRYTSIVGGWVTVTKETQSSSTGRYDTGICKGALTPVNSGIKWEYGIIRCLPHSKLFQMFCVGICTKVTFLLVNNWLESSQNYELRWNFDSFVLFG